MQQINKDEFIRIISERASFTQSDVRTIFDTMIDLFEECAESGTEISIRGFGKMEFNIVAGYSGYDPVNNRQITVPASKRVNFKLAENIRLAKTK